MVHNGTNTSFLQNYSSALSERLRHTPSWGGGGKYVFDPPTLTEDLRPRIFLKKSLPQAKNFWGPFFQKFDSFWEKLTVLMVFNGFQCVLNEK